jgi:uncharacterized membrane protein
MDELIQGASFILFIVAVFALSGVVIFIACYWAVLKALQRFFDEEEDDIEE